MAEEIKDINLDEMEEAAGGAKIYGDGSKILIKHEVVKGNTLSGLANRYNTSEKSIMNLNKFITDRNLIKIGWTLTIRTNDR